MVKKGIILTVASIFFLHAIALSQDKVEMADAMRENGKIYVVVVVCLTILIGLFLYVFYLDRKISNWEKKQDHND